MAKKPPAKKASLASRAAAKTPAGRALLKRALRDPGLRSKLPAQYLSAPQRQQRALTARLDAPAVPGSTMTERELARSANLQGAVKYGPAEAELKRQTAEAQQQQKDVGGFYDQYLARLAQGQTDINNIQQGVVTGLQGVGQGITGLGASSLQSLQSAANADAAARGTTAGDLTKTASDAAATRQALLGSFQAQQQLVGGARQAYASGLANVVGPGQKLAAVAQEAGRVRKFREKRLEQATEKGTYIQQQRAAGRAEEAKNVLAKEIATGKEATTLAGLRETVRSHKAGEALTGAKIAADATQKAATAAAKAADKAAKAHEPNKYGVPADQWASWSTSHRQRIIDARGTKGTKPADTAKQFQDKYGVKPAATAAIRAMRNDISTGRDSLRTILGQLKGTPSRQELVHHLTAGHPKTKDEDFTWPTVDPLTAAVVADYWQFGGITGGTAIRLHAAGYSVPTLGVKNRPPFNRAAAKAVPVIGGQVK